MIRSTLVSLGSLQHYCWLHRNFPRRNKVPGKHFLIEIPLRKWCHSHSLEYAAQCNNNTMKYHKSPSYKCSANSSINPILCQTNTLPSKSRSSDCRNIITFLHLHSLRLNSSDWNNKHQVQVSEHVFIIWTLSGDPHIGGHKKYSINALSIQWNLISICHVS